MSIKYPETFAEVGRQNIIVAANTKIRPLDGGDFQSGESPMKTYKPWSVLNLNFANSETKSGGSGAIEISHISDVKIRTMIAMKEIMENERRGMLSSENNQTESGASALLETKIYFLPKEISSDMRGKTALEIAKASGGENARIAAQNLRKSAENNEKYKKQNLKQAEAMELAAIIADAEFYRLPTQNGEKTIRELFAENVEAAMRLCMTAYAQNPNNPPVIAAAALLNAIKKDSSVQNIIKNKADSKSSSGSYKIYPQTLKTPNIEKRDRDGYTKAYSLCVTCNPTQLPYPFRVELQTMLGKPLANRQVGIDGSTIKDKKTFSIDLMTWEWMNIIERADWEAKLVALWAHEEQYNTMVKAVNENRQASQNPSQGNYPSQSYGYGQQNNQAPVQGYGYSTQQPSSYPQNQQPYPQNQNMQASYNGIQGYQNTYRN